MTRDERIRSWLYAGGTVAVIVVGMACFVLAIW